MKRRIQVVLAGAVAGWLAGAAAWAQAPQWQVALAAGGSTATVAASASDGGSNVYLVGRFTGTASFGSTSLTSAGSGDAFVARWNRPAGAFQWARRLGGGGDDYGYAVAVSSAGVYVGGSFAGTADFGATTLTSVGGDDGFVAKLSDDGSVAWAQAVAGADDDQVTALTARGATVYAGGIFNSATASVGGLALANASTRANGFTADGFVVRLTDAGGSASVGWARAVGGAGTDDVRAVAAGDASVYVVGGFSSTVSFGNTTLTGGSLSAYYTKLRDGETSSTYGWALASGGIVIPNAVAASPGGVYAAGRFLFSGSWGSTAYASQGMVGGYDVFVTKIVETGAAGSFAWTLAAGGPASDYASSLAVRGSGVYVAGGFSGTATFGSLSATSVSNSDDWFVARITDAGASATYSWVQPAGGSAYEQATGVALGSGTTVYVAGNAAASATFGTLAVSGLSSSRSGTLAALSDPALPTHATTNLPGLTVFPNPAHGTATVRVPAGAGAATVQVLDALGRVVRRDNVLAGTDYALGLGGLTPGLYAVRVQVGEATATQRLAIE